MKQLAVFFKIFLIGAFLSAGGNSLFAQVCVELEHDGLSTTRTLNSDAGTPSVTRVGNITQVNYKITGIDLSDAAVCGNANSEINLSVAFTATNGDPVPTDDFIGVGLVGATTLENQIEMSNNDGQMETLTGTLSIGTTTNIPSCLAVTAEFTSVRLGGFAAANDAATITLDDGTVIMATSGTFSYDITGNSYLITPTGAGGFNARGNNIKITVTGSCCNCPTAPTLASNTPICSGEDAIFTVTGTAGDMVDYTGATAGTAMIGTTGSVNITVPAVSANTTLNLTNVKNSDCTVPLMLSETVSVNSNPTAVAGTDQAICAGASATIGGTATGGTGPYIYSWDNGATAVAMPTVMPTATTTYAVTVTDGNNCTAMDAVVVTVNPIPTAVAGVDQAICTGASATIGGIATGGTAPYIYAWDNGAAAVAMPTVMPVANTTYTVLVTDGNSCTAEDAVAVLINPIPNAPAATIIQPACPSLATGTITVTTPIAGATYTLSGPMTASNTTGTFSALTPGIYSLTVTVGGCPSSATLLTVNTQPICTVPVINDPNIYDPCSCENPLNVVAPNGITERLHDFIIVTDDPGEIWTLSAVNSGDVLTAAGDPIVLNTPLIYDATIGAYRLDLYHNPDIGFNATVTRARDGFMLSTGGTCSCAPPIPTMSEWGLMIFCLLLLNLGILFIGVKRNLSLS